MEMISRQDFANLLKVRQGSSWITVFSETAPGKKGVKKVAETFGLIGNDYEKSVQTATENPEFKAGSRLWGQRVGQLIEHKGKTYLRMRRGQTKQSRYYYNGQLVDYSWLLERGLVSKPRQQKPVEMRNFTLTNVTKVKLDGKTYFLTD